MRDLDRKAYIDALKRIANQTKSAAIEPHVLLKLIKPVLEQSDDVSVEERIPEGILSKVCDKPDFARSFLQYTFVSG